ncbi:DUF445 domain-containing protein [Aliikangiella sp. G2MR2-5]|uniref:DUF445 domain-containing protein n=1 Tax=Aliikangiella sp. G2MR2-5 TaxID=2788943 RepID=UPI0018A8BB7A|nr:DUF445 domain-containing protein [Aliikangiella sp. G2MR2-5]
MNKSLITNLVSFACCILGLFTQSALILNIGLFSFSGAITNWLAVHMLFERVPGLYGSGVIPARFEDFKLAIKTMMMEQFFTDDNIDKFLSTNENTQVKLNLAPVIEKVDMSPAFEKLLKTIMESSFGGMLNMFGGQEALLPLKEPFMENMKFALIEMTEEESFSQLVKDEIESPEVLSDIKSKVESIIAARLEELTPSLVKQIVQDMIKKHLGWLVVWGGVFGAVIGLLSTFALS